MTNENAIKWLENLTSDIGNQHYECLWHYAPALVEITAMLKEQPEVIRCKDCVHNGKIEKCMLAAIAEEKGYPLFMLDNCGEWFCADGKRK